jgi:hypothetical protein
VGEEAPRGEEGSVAMRRVGGRDREVGGRGVGGAARAVCRWMPCHQLPVLPQPTTSFYSPTTKGSGTEAKLPLVKQVKYSLL